MKINMPKRTPAQKRKRETDLLDELCTHHGYMISDTLPKDERITMAMITTPRAPIGRFASGGALRRIVAAPAVKLVVPESSALGREVLRQRKERDPRTSKAARERAKARAEK